MQQLRFSNSFTATLPADPETRNYRRQVFNAAFSRVHPTAVTAPSIVAISAECAALVGAGDLHASGLGADDCELAAVLAGNRVVDGMDPFAACYGGHQFGNWARQLGDGRAITLGETTDNAAKRWEWQLKGAGPTPYSRMGDGRAVMRSSVREFLCSEAMHHLGVPTTRALSLVATGDDVVRDMFYDGNPRPEPGAIVCRIAPTFLRFGNFELAASRRDTKLLAALADYAITTHFPHLLASPDAAPTPQTYAAFFAEVVATTAAMVVDWMRVGFVHGVMNTDNMSILGLTIDYGPYGWLENYDPRWTPNTTDAHGRRYAYGNQPSIAYWNLLRFGDALATLLDDPQPLQDALNTFGETTPDLMLDMFAAKLGLQARRQDDDTLVNDLLNVLATVETDAPIFFRNLADVPSDPAASDEVLLGPIAAAWYLPDEVHSGDREVFAGWLKRYNARLRETADGDWKVDDERRREAMNRVNPKYVLRNYLAQLAIDAAEKGDGSKVLELLDVMRRPYDEQPGREQYAEKRPEWARHRPGCSMLSCSS